MTTITLTDRELATVLAALRCWQNRLPLLGKSHGITEALIQEVATNCGTIEALSAEDIDGLCERLNLEEEERPPAARLTPAYHTAFAAWEVHRKGCPTCGGTTRGFLCARGNALVALLAAESRAERVPAAYHSGLAAWITHRQQCGTCGGAARGFFCAVGDQLVEKLAAAAVEEEHTP